MERIKTEGIWSIFSAFRCPEDQVYDLKQNQCDHIEFVPECRNAENPSSSSTPNPIQMSKITAAPELSKFFGLLISPNCCCCGDYYFTDVFSS